MSCQRMREGKKGNYFGHIFEYCVNSSLKSSGFRASSYAFVLPVHTLLVPCETPDEVEKLKKQ